jgi:hypothetical protein
MSSVVVEEWRAIAGLPTILRVSRVVIEAQFVTA